jgi:cysteine desulfurase / selenocysteine lyase
MDVKKIRKDFPILSRKINGKDLIYFDNSATSQIPFQVIDEVINFETIHRSNVHRGIHTLSEESTNLYENARKTVAEFISAVSDREIIFLRNATEGVNLISNSWGRDNIEKGDIIVVTDVEHHSNLIPWQILAKEKGAKIQFLRVNQEGFIDIKSSNIEWGKVKLVSLFHISNVLGTIQNISDIVKQIKKKYKNKEQIPLIVLDAAQSVPHIEVNVQKLGIDFMVFSGHKMCGPFGIGVLWGKREVLEKLSPYNTGGGMIDIVTEEISTFTQFPERFEAGTPNISGAIGLAAACRYLSAIGMKNIEQYEKELTNYALNKLMSDDEVIIYGAKDNLYRSSIISFNIKNVPAHDTSAVFDTEGIAVRSGYHCVMPWHKRIGQATVRASFYFYNTKEEIDKMIEAIEKVKFIIGRRI